MTQSDPTDHALAAIASISITRSPIASRKNPRPAGKAPDCANEADGYSKVGPGPMAAIRFKWTVRRVARTANIMWMRRLGRIPLPLSAGPMSREDAVKLVDDRQSKARERFEQLKSEMAGRAATNLARSDIDES